MSNDAGVLDAAVMQIENDLFQALDLEIGQETAGGEAMVNHLPKRVRYLVVRRNGDVTDFDSAKISNAVLKAFLAVEGDEASGSARIHDCVSQVTTQVLQGLGRYKPNGGTVQIEEIQDQVELALMRSEHHKVARAYVLYREARHQERLKVQQTKDPLISLKNKKAKLSKTQSPYAHYKVKLSDGQEEFLNVGRIEALVADACKDLQEVAPQPVLEQVWKNIYDGMREDELAEALCMSGRILIEKEPNYSYVTARLLMDRLRSEALTFIAGKRQIADPKLMGSIYPQYFTAYIQKAISFELIDPVLASYDLKALGQAIKPERDDSFTYLGLQTLYDRYFLHQDKHRFELPQAFFMRVAMGLAINEKDRTARSIEFYNLLSSFDFMSSTPTLFNSGTLRPQLSSCYLTTVPDDLSGIYDAIRDNALLSKFAGGLGNDWTPVRALGAKIKGTNGESQGVIPFLKVANDTAVAVNQGGKRKGAVCAYLETWHLDVEDYLELRKNTGDERRRTHDMNTANWVPDLFMKRVAEKQEWTLFSPSEAPDLHDLYGKAFEEKYHYYEGLTKTGQIKAYKTVQAVDLWRKMLSMVFETGHPWITFKDPCNVRSPQQHVGVVHSSNLCTEITLNTSSDEIAVCNLGSINLANHVGPQGLNVEKLKRTIVTAMRMLDNVIDYNYYSVPQARNSNLKHRPVGMGIMAFQDALYMQRTPYASDAAVEFADQVMEYVSYFAIEASSDLAVERGTYSSYQGSLWDQGILPFDSLDLLDEARGGYCFVDRTQRLDWDSLRNKVQKQGMRNSNTMAIAPTATISNICGVGQSIEPTYQNLFVKSNLSGEFTVINPYLVHDLKHAGLWDELMVSDLKYYDGSIQKIERIPQEIKNLYTTAFEMDTRWLIEAASRRQKWIDQAQSLNLYLANPDGKKLDNLYKLAWVKGLKTTYYLRSMGASHVEKSTLKGTDGKLNAVKLQPEAITSMVVEPEIKFCSIDNPDCEACQ